MRREIRSLDVTLADFIESVAAGAIPSPHVIHLVVICYRWVGDHIVVVGCAIIAHRLGKK
jgi:hypothetical protein